MYADGAALVLDPHPFQVQGREQVGQLLEHRGDRFRLGWRRQLPGGSVPAFDAVLTEHDHRGEPGVFSEAAEANGGLGGTAGDDDDLDPEDPEPGEGLHRSGFDVGLLRIVDDRGQGSVEVHPDDGQVGPLPDGGQGPFARVRLGSGPGHGPSVSCPCTPVGVGPAP